MPDAAPELSTRTSPRPRPRRWEEASAAACPGAASRARSAPGSRAAGLLAAGLIAGLLAAVAVPGPAHAQQGQRPDAGGDDEFHASPYLPLDHWANDILDYWIHTGRVDGLSPLTRPWRRMDVARAIREVDRSRPYPFEERWLERLRDAFGPELERLRGADDEREGYVRGRFEAGGRYMSQTHRDPLRPELEGRFSADRVLDRFWFDVDGRVGPVVGGVSVGRDRLLINDAQFPDGRVVEKNDFLLFDEQSIRFDEGYLEAQSEHASLFFGRMNRNWGLPGMDGFILSDYGYSYEDVGYRVGTDDVFLIGSVTSFGDAPGDTARYLTTHRIEARPADELVLALTEATIHGGPDQSLDLRLVNPISVWQIVSDRQQNTIAQFDVWWRPARGLALYGSANLDATNSLGSSRQFDSCCEIGGSLGLELPGLVRGWRFRAQVTALQSLVYRTSVPWEEWSHRGIGLGWDKTDLYLGTLEAEWVGRPGLVLRPRLDVQVKGEGTFRDRLRPPPEELPTFPRILVGEAETTVRPALAGRWRPQVLGDGWRLDLEWDLGVNVIRDFGHDAGDDRTAFVGEVKAVIQTPQAFFGLD